MLLCDRTMYERSPGRGGRREDRLGHIERQSGRPDNHDSRSDGSSESDGQDSDSGVEQVMSYGQNGVSIDLSPGKKFLLLHEEESGGGRLVEACGGGRRSARFSEF
jgi:hypothetical protein